MEENVNIVSEQGKYPVHIFTLGFPHVTSRNCRKFFNC